MKTAFKKAAYEIATHGEGRLPREGYVAGQFGIAKERTGRWVVTHLPSGLAISVLARRTLAETKAAVAAALETYTGWEAETIYEICAANSVEPREMQSALFRLGRSDA